MCEQTKAARGSQFLLAAKNMRRPGMAHYLNPVYLVTIVARAVGLDNSSAADLSPTSLHRVNRQEMLPIRSSARFESVSPTPEWQSRSPMRNRWDGIPR